MRTLALKLRRNQTEKWREREVFHVVTQESGPSCCDAREWSVMLWRQRGPSCCDIRERSVMLWREREVRHVVTSERSIVLWREREVRGCFDVRERSVVLWHQREVRHAVTWERGPSCCNAREVRHIVTWGRSVMLWRGERCHVIMSSQCCDVRGSFRCVNLQLKIVFLVPSPPASPTQLVPTSRRCYQWWRITTPLCVMQSPVSSGSTHQAPGPAPRTNLNKAWKSCC